MRGGCQAAVVENLEQLTRPDADERQQEIVDAFRNGQIPGL
jgi:hypothetical protein